MLCLLVLCSFAGRCPVSYSGSAPLRESLIYIRALARVASLGQRNWILKVSWGNEERVKHAARDGVGDQVILLGRLDHPALES